MVEKLKIVNLTDKICILFVRLILMLLVNKMPKKETSRQVGEKSFYILII